MSFLHQALVFLVAAVVTVPIFKRLGLGSLLGYLAAGVAIGPWGVKLISDVQSVLHIAEWGVVLLLFVIGLELKPTRLWQMRRTVFGSGLAQVVGTTIVLGALGVVAGLSLPTALIAAAGLSMSSTAFALQLLTEKNQLTRDYGQVSFGILLFQDLAVIPLLALVPLLGERAAGAAEVPVWISIAKVVGVLAAVFVVGRYVLRPLFKLVAGVHSQELMTATALLIVVGTALGANLAGLSMALGAFLAGVLLAESEYRHEIEADIEPFKGLLLGLFFMAVGMSVDVGTILGKPLLVVALVFALIAVKFAVLFVVGQVTIRKRESALSLAVVISQGGEFAFVLFRIAVGHKAMEPGLADLLVVVVTLSMALTPLLYFLHERLVRPKFDAKPETREFDVPPPDNEAPVIIAGFGRVGQVVARVLLAKRIRFTALDSNPTHIDFIRRFGNEVFYGDAARLDLLRAARADKAKIFVLAIDDLETSLRVAKEVREHFPHLVIYARARNRQHAYRLLDLGIAHVIRDTFAASLDLTADVLKELGLPHTDARRAVDRFREHDEALLRESYQYHHDLGKLTQMAMRARDELEKIFREDERSRSL